jgi:hypothetical protein
MATTIKSNISTATQMKFNAAKVKEGMESQKIIMSHYKTITDSDNYNEAAFPYIANMYAIFNYFKNITSKHTASMVTLYSRRIAGVFKSKSTTTLSTSRLELLNKISKELFAFMLPYTGANLVFTNISDPDVSAEEMYHLINNITPIGYAMKLSATATIFSVLDDEKAQEMAEKFDKMNLAMYEVEDDDSTTKTISEQIRVCYMSQKTSMRTTTFDWGKKSSEETYKVESLGLSVPMRKVLEHSEYMRTEFNKL